MEIENKQLKKIIYNQLNLGRTSFNNPFTTFPHRNMCKEFFINILPSGVLADNLQLNLSRPKYVETLAGGAN